MRGASKQKEEGTMKIRTLSIAIIAVVLAIFAMSQVSYALGQDPATENPTAKKKVEGEVNKQKGEDTKPLASNMNIEGKPYALANITGIPATEVLKNAEGIARSIEALQPDQIAVIVSHRGEELDNAITALENAQLKREIFRAQITLDSAEIIAGLFNLDNLMASSLDQVQDRVVRDVETNI